MANDEPKRTVSTGTVVDSDRPPLPGLEPVPLQTQVQSEAPYKPLCVSTQAIERYALKEEIGRGGMGAVYYARDTVLNRDVAVKVLQDRYGAAGPAAARFIEEARITGQLQHPGIPPVHDLGTLPDGRPFMAMKLIRGKTLSALLGSHEKPDPTRLLAVFEQICQTVAYAHAKHVIHRDLKPGNIMVGAFGEVQVMDWGLAKVVEARGNRASEAPADPLQPEDESDAIQTERSPGTHTVAGSTMGTPAFMPPEQARGELDRVDARADVFCLGGILCEMLTGKPTYTGSGAEVRAKATLGQLTDAHARLAGCGADPDVIAVAKACLSAEPEARPGHAGAVAEAIAAYRNGLDARLRQAEVDRAKAETQAAESRKRARLRLVLLGLGLVFVGVFTFYNLMLSRANEDAKKANDEASTANEGARQANQAAKDNNALTEDAIDRFVAGLGESDKLKKYDDLRDVRRKLLTTAVDFNKKLLARGGDELRLKYKRAEVHLTLGALYAELEDGRQSEAEYRLAREEFAALFGANAADDRALAGLASATNRLGNTLERLGGPTGAPVRADPKAVADLYDEAIRLRRTLVGRHPTPEHRIDLATTLSNLAALCSVHPDLSAGRADPATLFREAETILRPLVTGPDPPFRAETQYARVETNFATYLFGKNDPTFAKELEVAKAAFERTVGRYPDNDDLRFEYVRFAYKVGLMWFEKDSFAQAETWLALAASECGTVVDAHPGVLKYRMQYADVLLSRAVAGYETPGRPREAALPYFQAALEQVRRLVRDRPGQRDVVDLGLDVCDRLAAALTALGRHADAVPVWDEARTFGPPHRRRGLELRRELARARSGDAAGAVKNARSIAADPLKAAEEFGFYAAVLATASGTTRDGKPVFPPDEAARLTGDAKSAFDAAKTRPDYERVKAELADIPALKPWLGQ